MREGNGPGNYTQTEYICLLSLQRASTCATQDGSHRLGAILPEGGQTVKLLRRIWCWLRREHINVIRIGNLYCCRYCLTVWKRGEIGQ